VTLAFLASLLEQFERARRPGYAISVAVIVIAGDILIDNPEGTERDQDALPVRRTGSSKTPQPAQERFPALSDHDE
jgi:hypothetical protein